MTDIFKGVAAGLAASGCATGVLLVQRALGLFPEVDLIGLTSAVLGFPGDQIVGWVVCIVVAAVAGGALFAVIEQRLGADRPVKRGLLFGVSAWLAQMVLLMPAAGAGLFGLRLGVAAPLLTLLVAAIYGVVLGWVYGIMMPTPALDSHDSRHHHRAA